MKTEWDNVQFTFVVYRETGISILSAVDDIQVCCNKTSVDMYLVLLGFLFVMYFMSGLKLIIKF